MSHFVKKCVHGTVVTQCRCPSKDKTEIIVGCPSYCPQKDEPTKQRPEDQRLPVASGAPVSHRLVQDDLEKRLQVGIERYGQPLQAHNGRNSFLDAYEEVLDLAVYLKTLQVERADYAKKIIAVLNGDNGQRAKALLREILAWLEA